MEIDLILKGIKTKVFRRFVKNSQEVEIDLILKGIKTLALAIPNSIPAIKVEIDLILKGIKTVLPSVLP